MHVKKKISHFLYFYIVQSDANLKKTNNYNSIKTYF